MASPETVPRDLDETTVTIIQDTPERRLAVLGEIDEAYDHAPRSSPYIPPPPGPTPGAYLAGRHKLNRVISIQRPAPRRGALEV